MVVLVLVVIGTLHFVEDSFAEVGILVEEDILAGVGNLVVEDILVVGDILAGVGNPVEVGNLVGVGSLVEEVGLVEVLTIRNILADWLEQLLVEVVDLVVQQVRLVYSKQVQPKDKLDWH